MTPEQERAVERYILLPDSLSADARAAVEALLRSDDAARAWAHLLETTYDIAKQLSSSPVVDAFVDDLFPVAPVVALHRVPLSQTARVSQTARETVQAADANDGHLPLSGDTSNLDTMTVLLNEDEGVLVRLLHDRKNGAGRLYVLAHDRATWNHALVSLPNVDLDVPTDDSGVGAFTHTEDLVDGPLSEVFLRRVLSSHTISQDQLDPEVVQTFASEHTLRLQQRDGDLHVRLTTQPASAPTVQRIVIQGTDAEGHPVYRIARMSAGTAVLPLPPTSDTYCLRLYG